MAVTRQDFEEAVAAYWGVKETQGELSRIKDVVGAGTAGSVRGGRHFDDQARDLQKATPEEAAQVLGNGPRITAQDTVPFALWAATRHLDDYTAGIRACVSVGGDMDTTAAMAGGS